MANKHDRIIPNRGLAKRRRMCGLTQHALAQQSGVSVARITYAETGRCSLEASELERVRNVLRQRAKKALAAVA